MDKPYILRYKNDIGETERSDMMALCIKPLTACSPGGVVDQLLSVLVDDMGMSKSRAVAAIQAMVPVVARQFRAKRKRRNRQ